MKHLAELKFLNLVEDHILSNPYFILFLFFSQKLFWYQATIAGPLVEDPLGVKDLLYSLRKTTF